VETTSSRYTRNAGDSPVREPKDSLVFVTAHRLGNTRYQRL